jgi:hypothetical protein
MEYYPPGLTDWYLDDWISRVYGSERTRQAKSVEVREPPLVFGWVHTDTSTSSPDTVMLHLVPRRMRSGLVTPFHDFQIAHHVVEHGTRYVPDRTKELTVAQLLREGRKKIRRWMRAHNSTLDEIHAFDMSGLGRGIALKDVEA